MRRFFAPPAAFSAGRITLDTGETRHLRDVLRLRVGENVMVFDGAGCEFECSIKTIEKSETLLSIISEVSPKAPESPLDLTMAVAITKGEKYDLVVQKMVELGVTRFVPLTSKFCEVRPGSGEGKRAERWRRIVIEASKQSGRARLMTIDPVRDVRSWVVQQPRDSDARLMFSERGGEGLTTVDGRSRITALIGPEGGWADDEIACAADAGFAIVTLGGRVLRAETAAISTAAILQHRFGDLR